MTDQTAQEYLQSVVALDPASQAGAILALRRARRSTSEDRTPAVEKTVDREAARDRLSRIWSDVYTADPVSMQRELDCLDLSPYPDLEWRAARLSLLLSARHDIDAARDDPGTDEAFLEFALRVLAAPTQVAVDLKLRAKQVRATIRRSAAARRSVKLWKHEYPRLYELDPAWLEEVGKYGRPVNAVSFGMFVLFVVFLCIKALSYYMRHTSR